MNILKCFNEAIGNDPGNCVLIAGSGLSKRGVRADGKGLPDWDELTHLMVDYVEENKRCPATVIAHLRTLLAEDPPQYLDIADKFHEAYIHDLDGYERFLRRHLRPNDLVRSELHQLILGVGFKGIVSYNFDLVFEKQSDELDKIVYPDLLEQVAHFQRKGYFAKIHGCIDRPASQLILTGESFRKLSRSKNYTRLLESIVLGNRVLCVGFSLRDPDFQSILTSLKQDWGRQLPPLLALMPDPGDEARAEWLRNGIDILPYADHADVKVFFRQLAAQQSHSPAAYRTTSLASKRRNTVWPDAARIGAECRKRQWSATQLSWQASVDPRTIARALSGQPVLASSLARIANALSTRLGDISLDDLVFGVQPLMFLRGAPGPLEHFVGRVDEMRVLSESCISGKIPLIVVKGIGGQGKTQLVFQWLHTIGRDSHLPFRNVIFYSAYRFGADFRRFINDVIQSLDPNADVHAQSRDKLILALTGLLCEHPTLLIIDGIERWLTGWADTDDPQSVSKAADRQEQLPQASGLRDFLLQFISQPCNSRVILTTRALPACLDDREFTTIGGEGGHSHELPGLNDNEGADLLDRLGVKGEIDELRKTSHELAGHPLLLTTLGQQLVECYGGDVARRINVRQLGDEKIDTLLDRIANDLKVELPLLVTAAICSDDAPISALLAIHQEITESELRERIARLEKWGLARLTDDDTIVLHPLVGRHFANTCVNPDQLHQRLSAHFAAAPFDPNARNLQDVHAHVQAIEHALRAGDACLAASLFTPHEFKSVTLSQWLSARGFYEKSLYIGRQILKHPDLRRDEALFLQVQRSVMSDLKDSGHPKEAAELGQLLPRHSEGS